MIIAFEGIDGCGKSSVVKELINRHSEEWLYASQPSMSTELGRYVRDMVDGKSKDKVPPQAELLLWQAERLTLQNYLESVLQLTGRNTTNTVVILDRHTASSMVYQSKDRDLEFIYSALNGSWVPDVTILFDVSPATACRRKPEEDGIRLSILRSKYLSLFSPMMGPPPPVVSPSELWGQTITTCLLHRMQCLAGKKRIILDADQLSIDEIADKVEDLVESKQV